MVLFSTILFLPPQSQKKATFLLAVTDHVSAHDIVKQLLGP